jgi:two-component system, chemotaxis family, protein-glutamate methylesterase/glutaminase
MFIFCEECGKKMIISTKKKHSMRQQVQCTACGESVKIYDNFQNISSESIENNNSVKHLPNKSFRYTKVLLVDDSPFIRGVIRKIIEDSKSLKVVGEASNGSEALELIPRLDPDVVTLDINMPVMDGLTTLKHMMIKSPRPAVMISTLTREGASVTFDALKYGAIDFITKPSKFRTHQIAEQQENIIRKVSLAGNVEVGEIRYARSPVGKKISNIAKKAFSQRVITLGASEGGYSALLKIIPMLCSEISASVIVVLYAESVYVDAFVKYLNEHSAVFVIRPKNHEPLLAGTCYIASGNEYLTVEKVNGEHFLQLNPNPFPNRQGSINMLMMSAADNFAEKTMGAILSGGGNDGVEGLREILRQGGLGLVQDPRTCLCKDMVLSVLKNLQVDLVIPDREMANEFNQVR